MDVGVQITTRLIFTTRTSNINIECQVKVTHLKLTTRTSNINRVLGKSDSPNFDHPDLYRRYVLQRSPQHPHISWAPSFTCKGNIFIMYIILIDQQKNLSCNINCTSSLSIECIQLTNKQVLLEYNRAHQMGLNKTMESL